MLDPGGQEESTTARPAAECPAGRPVRIAVFTHDTFGLGHVRRSSHIIASLARHSPESAILFITGSPVLELLGDRAPNVDIVKVPTVAKTGAKGYRPPHLPLPGAELALFRSRLIRETLLAFLPDVLLVDNFPLGSQNELLPVLQELRRFPTTTVLGLRDILDAPEVVREEWARQRMYDVLERYYDRILVYGMRDVFDVADAYGLGPRIAAKLRYCGYVTGADPALRPEADVRRELGISGPFLVAAAGGGGDGFPLLKNVVRSMRILDGLSAVVVTGPLMSAAHKKKIRDLAHPLPRLTVLEFTKDLRSYMAAADVVVTMCGYNIAAEIASLGVRAVVCPRTWRYGEPLKRSAAGTEWEQLLRAETLEKLGRAELIEPESLSPGVLAEKIRVAISKPRPERMDGLAIQGAEVVARELLESDRRHFTGSERKDSLPP